MTLTVSEHTDFTEERGTLPVGVSGKPEALIMLIETFRPHLRWPYIDTLADSSRVRMKGIGSEDRGSGGLPLMRNAVVLVGGNTQNRNQKRFYAALVAIADKRFDDWRNPHRNDRQ